MTTLLAVLHRYRCPKCGAELTSECRLEAGHRCPRNQRRFTLFIEVTA